MTDQIVTEIARREGEEFRSIRLAIEEDGCIRLEGQDIGPRVAQIWGDNEYEFWVRVEATALPRLAFELLREKFAGQLGAVTSFRDWCQTHGIGHKFENWA